MLVLPEKKSQTLLPVLDYYDWNSTLNFDFSALFIYNWTETNRTLLGQLKRVTKKHGGQTEAKTSIFKGLLLNNGITLGAENSLMDFIFDAKETEISGECPYDNFYPLYHSDQIHEFASFESLKQYYRKKQEGVDPIF